MGQGRQPDLDCSASSFLESSKFTLSIHLSSLKPLFIFWLIYIQQYIKQNIVVVKKGEYDHNWISSLWAYHWQTKQWTCRRYKEERKIFSLLWRRLARINGAWAMRTKRTQEWLALKLENSCKDEWQSQSWQQIPLWHPLTLIKILTSSELSRLSNTIRTWRQLRGSGRGCWCDSRSWA